VTGTPHIIELIDNALASADGPDAMRWTPEPSATHQPQTYGLEWPNPGPLHYDGCGCPPATDRPIIIDDPPPSLMIGMEVFRAGFTAWWESVAADLAAARTAELNTVYTAADGVSAWTPLGYSTDEVSFTYESELDLNEPVRSFAHTHGHCACTFGPIGARLHHLLFNRTHPRIRRMHVAYHRRRRNHG
jgi:hypothetical protein